MYQFSFLAQDKSSFLTALPLWVITGVRKIRCFTQNSTAKLISCLSSKMEQLKILGVSEVPEARGGHSLEIPSKPNSVLSVFTVTGLSADLPVYMGWCQAGKGQHAGNQGAGNLFLKCQMVNGSGSAGLVISAPRLLSLPWRATPAFDFTPTNKGAGVPTERCFRRRDLTHGQSLLTSALEKRRLIHPMNLQSPDLLWFWYLVYKTRKYIICTPGSKLDWISTIDHFSTI